MFKAVNLASIIIILILTLYFVVILPRMRSTLNLKFVLGMLCVAGGLYTMVFQPFTNEVINDVIAMCLTLCSFLLLTYVFEHFI